MESLWAPCTLEIDKQRLTSVHPTESENRPPGLHISVQKLS